MNFFLLVSHSERRFTLLKGKEFKNLTTFKNLDVEASGKRGNYLPFVGMMTIGWQWQIEANLI